MIVSKFQFGLALGVLAATITGFVGVHRQNAQLRQEASAQMATAERKLAAIRQQLTTQTQRATAAEAQVTALLKEVKAGASARRAPPSGTTAATTDTQDLLKAVLARATQLKNEGKLQEALDEYVKCYRELQAKRPGSSECQSLSSAIKYLGRTYPAAIAALAELRDSTMAQLRANPGNRELVFDAALLNERLGEGARTLALYDALPPGDMGRQSLAMIAHASFVEAGRYTDALLGKSFGNMISAIDVGMQHAATQPSERQGPIRQAIVDTALTYIEVLTGAGKQQEARMLTEKLLSYDSSETTRAALAQRVERAGRNTVPRP